MTTVKCAGCGKSYAAAHYLLGKTVACPTCGTAMSIPCAEPSCTFGEYSNPPAVAGGGLRPRRVTQAGDALLSPFGTKLFFGLAAVAVVLVVFVAAAIELSNAVGRWGAEREAKQQAQAARAAEQQEAERKRKEELDRQETERKRNEEFVRQETERKLRSQREADEKAQLARIQEEERLAKTRAREEALAKENAKRKAEAEARIHLQESIDSLFSQGFFVNRRLQSSRDTPIRSKVLVVRENGPKPPRVDFEWLESSIPESIRAATSDEVRTIVYIKSRSQTVGRYLELGQITSSHYAWVVYYDVAVIDVALAATIGAKSFRGGDPPQSIRKGDFGTGSSPDREVGEWISKLPIDTHSTPLIPSLGLPPSHSINQPPLSPPFPGRFPGNPSLAPPSTIPNPPVRNGGVGGASPGAQGPQVGRENNKWPGYSGTLAGTREVRIRNPNDFSVKVGLRSGGKGQDFEVPKNGTRSVFVPDGAYEIYFVYSSDPDGVYQGDNFTLARRGIEISIVKVVNGNYGIRKVK